MVGNPLPRSRPERGTGLLKSPKFSSEVGTPQTWAFLDLHPLGFQPSTGTLHRLSVGSPLPTSHLHPVCIFT